VSRPRCWIIRQEHGFQVFGDAVKRSVTFHCDDGICDDEMRAHRCANVENAFVDSGPVEDILGPAVTASRNDSEHVFHAQRSSGPVMRLHLWHGYDEIGRENSSGQPEMAQAGIVGLKLGFDEGVAIQIDEMDLAMQCCIVLARPISASGLRDQTLSADPLDLVDTESLMRPHRWDVHVIRNFMLVIGPVSSVFDFLTFYIMLRVFNAGSALFQTGWFVESMATQVLVIFVIRTAKSPLRSRPHRWLTITSVGVVLIASIIPYTRVGNYFGFTPLPLVFFLILALMVGTYLIFVEVVKRVFQRRIVGGLF